MCDRCEYAFALYGSVFKFTLFTELRNFEDFMAFAGVDILIDTIKNIAVMTELFLVSRKFECRVQMVSFAN